MRLWFIAVSVALVALLPASAQQTSPASSGAGYTLTVVVEGVDERDGNVGMLVFNSPKGWADDRQVVDDLVDERLLGRVEHDVALRRGQNPHRHVARADMVEVVEHLEGLDLLNLDLLCARTFTADSES